MRQDNRLYALETDTHELKDRIEAVMRMLNAISSSVHELERRVYDLEYYDDDDDPRG